MSWVMRRISSSLHWAKYRDAASTLARAALQPACDVSPVANMALRYSTDAIANDWIAAVNFGLRSEGDVVDFEVGSGRVVFRALIRDPPVLPLRRLQRPGLIPAVAV